MLLVASLPGISLYICFPENCASTSCRKLCNRYKPSEVTPVTAFILSELCLEAGLPPGVLNIVHGNGKTAGVAIITHPNIKAISFTGGTKTGAHIAKAAAPLFKKTVIELGGKNPNIIFADCDYEKMLETTVKSFSLTKVKYVMWE